MIYFFPPHFISFIRPDTDTLFPPTHQRAMIQYFLSHKNSCSIGKPLHRDGKVDFHGNFSGSLVSRHFFFFKYSFSSNAIFTLFSLSTLQLRSFFRLAFAVVVVVVEHFFSANSHKLNTQILPLRTKSKSFRLRLVGWKIVCAGKKKTTSKMLFRLFWMLGQSF